MELPIQLAFFRKLELYQEMRSRDKSALGPNGKAWSAEKEILRWAATKHHHLGTPISETFVEQNILTNTRTYDNPPDDAKRPMENLVRRGWAEWENGEKNSLLFLKEGLLMGAVIDDVERGGKCRYELLYLFTWLTAFCGALLVIVSALRIFGKYWWWIGLGLVGLVIVIIFWISLVRWRSLGSNR